LETPIKSHKLLLCPLPVITKELFVYRQGKGVDQPLPLRSGLLVI